MRLRLREMIDYNDNMINFRVATFDSNEKFFKIVIAFNIALQHFQGGEFSFLFGFLIC